MKLAIIIPAFNEELAIRSTIETINSLIEKYVRENIISSDSYFLIVNDGSKDKTWEVIQETKKSMPRLKAIKFSKNFGNQSAIVAGYQYVQKAGCDAAVTIDADLQQDEEKIKDFVQAYKEGYDIVCGIRQGYHNKYSLKSITSSLFYKLINFLGVKLVPNHSEYRLISKKGLDILAQYHETNIFVRGMISDIGLKTKNIEYSIKKRALGESKFNFVSLTRMAIGGIISFSARPLRFVFFAGVFVAFVSSLLAFLMLIQILFKADILSPSIAPYEVWETFIAAVQILCIGIIGEYIGQILLEVKGRPRYIIEDEIK